MGQNPRLVGDVATQVPATPEPPSERIQRINLKRQTTRKNLEKAKLDQAANTNRRRRAAPTYLLSDQVLLSTKDLPQATVYPKTAPEWIGPFTITACYPQTDNYTLDLPKEYGRIHPTYHVESIKRYITKDNKRFPARKYHEPGPLPQFKNEELYEVDRILASRTRPRKGMVEYKIKWKGYSHKYDKWMTADNIAPDLIEEFNQRTSSSVTTKRTTARKKKAATRSKRKSATIYRE